MNRVIAAFPFSPCGRRQPREAGSDEGGRQPLRLIVASAFANAQNFTPRKSSQPMICQAKQDISTKTARLDFAVARQYVARGLEKACLQGRVFSDQAVPGIRIIS